MLKKTSPTPKLLSHHSKKNQSGENVKLESQMQFYIQGNTNLNLVQTSKVLRKQLEKVAHCRKKTH